MVTTTVQSCNSLSKVDCVSSLDLFHSCRAQKRAAPHRMSSINIHVRVSLRLGGPDLTNSDYQDFEHYNESYNGYLRIHSCLW